MFLMQASADGTINVVALVEAIRSESWTGVVALLTWLLIALSKRYASADKLPSQWQWVRPFVLAFLIGFAEALSSGGSFMVGLFKALEAAGLGGPLAMLLHGVLKSSPLPYGSGVKAANETD